MRGEVPEANGEGTISLLLPHIWGVDQLATRRKGKLVGDTCHKSHSKADRIDCFLDEIEN
jgi:hypothetical protein